MVLHQRDLTEDHPLLQLKKPEVNFFPVDVPTIGPTRELTMFRLRGFINKHSIFHCLSSYLPAFGVHIPSIVTIHDLKYLLFPEFFSNRFKTLYYSWIIRKGIRSASYLVAVSEATKRDVENLSIRSGRMSVIYEASTVMQGKTEDLPNILRNREYFLFVGEQRPHKNTRRLVDAYRIVRHKLKDSCPALVFAGSKLGSQEELMHDDIITLGPVGERLLTTLYKKALALVYPSLYEGFGLPIVEAMSLGTPVITSDCSSMREVAGDAALLVNPQSTAQLVAAMVKLAERKEFAMKLTSLGYSRVKAFSWDVAASEVCNVYQQLL